MTAETDEGLTVAVVGDLYRILATGDETDGKYAMFEAVVSGRWPPPHIHSREEESFYILEGEITSTVGDDQIVATAGTFANIPCRHFTQLQERHQQDRSRDHFGCTSRP